MPRLPAPPPFEYLGFASLLLERPLGIPLLEAGALAVAQLIARRTRGADLRAQAVILLTLFSFSFAALTAVGRVCLGIDAAVAARYGPDALPALLALVIAVRAWAPAALQPRALAVLLKQRSRACLLEREGSAAVCERETGFALHPNPTATRLQQKLDWLRARRLGPFRDRD